MILEGRTIFWKQLIRLTIEEQKEKEKQYNFNDQVIRTLSFHRHPIKFIKMNWAYKFCVSIDERAFL